MTELYRLGNPIKHYAWGSPHYIPELLGIQRDGTPFAELWMGAHSASPSQVSLPAGNTNLNDLIAQDPCRYLGTKAAEQYGALPFLFKLLAAESPLSIQAHPNQAQAREGFERENRAGIPIDAPNRNYRDANCKPEIICALTPFTGMCGFRSPKEICRLLELFRKGTKNEIVDKSISSMVRILEIEEKDTLRNFLSELFGMSSETREALTEYILSARNDEECSQEFKLMREFAGQYPGDPAIIAPLYLNVFHLEPGEAILLNAGILHAYCSGFGIELMGNSDNVLRGGLTAKNMDIPELMNVLDFNPFAPNIIKAEPDVCSYTYPVFCGEFALSVMRGNSKEDKNNLVALSQTGPLIAIVTEGEVLIENTIIQRGGSIFIPPVRGSLALKGNYTLYIASVP